MKRLVSAIAVVVLMVLSGIAAVAWFQWKNPGTEMRWEATVVLEIKNEDFLDPSVRSEFESRIRRPEFLAPIAGKLRLAENWQVGPAEANRRLAAATMYTWNADQLSITVRESGKDLVGEIARTVANACRDEIFEMTTERHDAELAELEREIERQTKVVEEKKSVLDTIMRMSRGEDADPFELPDKDAATEEPVEP